MPSERRDQQVDRQNDIKPSDGILKTDWHENITLPDNYSAHRYKFISMLTQFKNM